MVYVPAAKSREELIANLRAGTAWQGDLDLAADMLEQGEFGLPEGEEIAPAMPTEPLRGGDGAESDAELIRNLDRFADGIVTTGWVQDWHMHTLRDAKNRIAAFVAERDDPAIIDRANSLIHEANTRANDWAVRAEKAESDLAVARSTSDLMERRWKDSEEIRGNLVTELAAARAEIERLKDQVAM